MVVVRRREDDIFRQKRIPSRSDVSLDPLGRSLRTNTKYGVYAYPFPLTEWLLMFITFIAYLIWLFWLISSPVLLVLFRFPFPEVHALEDRRIVDLFHRLATLEDLLLVARSLLLGHTDQFIDVDRN